MRNLSFFALIITFISCNSEDNDYQVLPLSNTIYNYPAISATFGSTINVNNLSNYANQTIPNYITKDNSNGNIINNKIATLGRVLFYDKNLSSTNTIACASCHKQEFAFGDNTIASTGANGSTARHSMRLVNSRFTEELKFFWDERANSLEQQTTMPIKDHGEMGFSGTNGDPSFNDLLIKLSNIAYYKEFFEFAYGTDEITETRIQTALAQFIRSIQSFDSKYDIGRILAPNNNVPFTNFTAQENNGKNLFMQPPTFNTNGVRTGGGLGCAGCHRAPEFDIDPNSRSNGIGGSINGGSDFTVTRAPSLRNLVKLDGTTNGQMMHTGVITSLQAAIGHYGNLTNAAINNPNLDPRLKPNGVGQQLQLNATEVDAVIAFLKTLSGSDVYINSKWSNPF